MEGSEYAYIYSTRPVEVLKGLEDDTSRSYRKYENPVRVSVGVQNAIGTARSKMADFEAGTKLEIFVSRAPEKD